ncbi:MAG: hypothetical protein KDC07_11420 [Chitinophagaceae bacterium]|nr:hypothetical protein [Chitinophagaceae bacterium]
MSNPRFDLVDIVQTLRKQSKLLIIAVVASSLLGALFYVVGKKKYKAEADFIISNPLYADRNNLYRTRDTRFVDYFGGDDDIDRVLVIAGSDTLRNTIADKLDLWDAYKLKKDDPKDRLEMKEIFKNLFKMERTEYTTAKVYYKDTDPERAAAVVNLAIETCENIFRGYYLTMKNNVANSVNDRNDDIDSTITALTTEEMEIGGKMGSAGKEEQMMLRDKIEEINVVKKQLMEDKARNLSILNELKTGATPEDRSRYLQVITPAAPPAKPAGIGFVLTVIGAGFFGFFFVAIYLMIISYYRLIIAVER